MQNHPNNNRPLDGYVRVSKTRGRKGTSSYHAPDDQEQAIRDWAEANGVRLGEVIREEDVSGSKALAARELGRLVEKAERGESGGLVVAYPSRFARSHAQVAETIERLTDARNGARLVAATNSGCDTSKQGGELMWNVYAAFAREEWQRVRENFGKNARRAAADGVHLGKSSCPPLAAR